MSAAPTSPGNAISVTARLKKLSAMSRSDWSVLGYACLLTPAVWVSLRVFGLPRTLAWAAGPRPTLPASHTHARPPASFGRLVNIAARYGPVRSACLVRSLVLIRILSGRGVTGSLRIGVRKGVSSQLDAHAWVEYEGVPVNDQPNVATDFAVFDTLDKSIVGALL